MRSEIGRICRNFPRHREWGSSRTREKAENFVDIEEQREGRGFWYWLAFLQPPIWLSVSVSSVCIRLLQLCADRFPHSMDQDQHLKRHSTLMKHPKRRSTVMKHPKKHSTLMKHPKRHSTLMKDKWFTGSPIW